MIAIKRAYQNPEGSIMASRYSKRERPTLKKRCVNLARVMNCRKVLRRIPHGGRDFCKSLMSELKRPESGRLLAELEKITRSRTLTLVYSARGQEHNHAVVLGKLLDGCLQRGV